MIDFISAVAVFFDMEAVKPASEVPMKLNTARFPMMSAVAVAAAIAALAASATAGEARHHKAGARGSVASATLATATVAEPGRPQYHGGPKSPMYP